MKIRNAFLGIAIGAASIACGPLSLAQGPPPQYQGPPPPGYGPQPWEAPPSQYQRDVQQQGFHDGVEGARKDFQNHRQPNVNNRDEYRHPRFSGPDRQPYREAFRNGYQVGVQHIYNGGGPR